MKSHFFIGLTIIILFGTFFVQNNVQAYGECTQYGVFATYDYLTGYCKCISGYVFGKDILGSTTCVSADSVCHDKYGYNSRYNSLNNSCECSYGYVFGTDYVGRTQCISEDRSCQNKYGLHAESDFGGGCKCSYGYVVDNGTCEYGSTVCHSKHGFNSSFNSLNNTCECDNGYTLDDNSQCVKKQNNVYFFLEELDVDNSKAIIKSNYDYREYLVEYGIGCLSIENYVGKNIVVNLGTDFDLDTWDKIVLQNNDQTCSILYKESASSYSNLCKDGYVLKNNKCLEISCPLNSARIGSDCFCNSGYEVDSTGVQCRKIVVAQPNPITNNNYKNESVSVNTNNVDDGSTSDSQPAKKIELSALPSQNKTPAEGPSNGDENRDQGDKRANIFSTIINSIKNFFKGIFRK